MKEPDIEFLPAVEYDIRTVQLMNVVALRLLYADADGVQHWTPLLSMTPMDCRRLASELDQAAVRVQTSTVSAPPRQQH